MEPMTTSKKSLILITFIVYIIHLVFQGLAAKGGPHSALFPNSPENVSAIFPLEITPVGKTFAIWGLIFLFQLIWLIYTVTTVFRSSSSTNILSSTFYIAFIVNVTMITSWLFAWARVEGVIAFVLTTIGQIAICTAIGYSFYDLKVFLDQSKESSQGNGDVWCLRILVQNGLEFYGTWTTIATLLNFAIVLSYYVGVPTKDASLFSLLILGLLVITWFVLENSVFLKYTQYTISSYIVLMIALLGVLAHVHTVDHVLAGITVGLLILSAIFFVLRAAVIFSEHRNNHSMKYSTLK